MKRVHARCGSQRRPVRRTWIAIAVLAVGIAGLAGSAVWQARRVHDLGGQLAALADQRRAAAQAAPPHPDPPYGDSARLFLRAREAAWAPALRSLESAAMLGVTPTRVEFDAAEGTARAELVYDNAQSLHDYLSRLNDGLPVSSRVGQWTLLETHAQATPPALPGAGSAVATSAGVATIRASWR